MSWTDPFKDFVIDFSKVFKNYIPANVNDIGIDYDNDKNNISKLDPNKYYLVHANINGISIDLTAIELYRILNNTLKSRNCTVLRVGMNTSKQSTTNPNAAAAAMNSALSNRVLYQIGTFIQPGKNNYRDNDYFCKIFIDEERIELNQNNNGNLFDKLKKIDSQNAEKEHHEKLLKDIEEIMECQIKTTIMPFLDGNIDSNEQNGTNNPNGSLNPNHNDNLSNTTEPKLEDMMVISRNRAGLYTIDDQNPQKKANTTKENKRFADVMIWVRLKDIKHLGNLKVEYQNKTIGYFHAFSEMKRIKSDPNSHKLYTQKFNKTNINFIDFCLGTFETISTGQNQAFPVFTSTWSLDELLSSSPLAPQSTSSSSPSLLSGAIKALKIFSFPTNLEQSEKLIEIVFSIPQKRFQLKIEFRLKFCKEIKVQQNKDTNHIEMFFKMDVLPKFYGSYYTNEEYKSYMYNEKWERLPNVFLPNKIDRFERYHINNNMVLKLKFTHSQDEIVGDLNKLLMKIQDVNIKFELSQTLIYQTVKRDHIKKKFFPSCITYDAVAKSVLPFQTKYELFCCLIKGLFNIYYIPLTIIKEFEKKENRDIVTKTLRDISIIKDLSQFQGRGLKYYKSDSVGNGEIAKNDYLDFCLIFNQIYEENYISKDLASLSIIKEHMMSTKRATITPTRVIFHSEEPELSNSILRKYKEFRENFMRVTFNDELDEGTKNMKFITSMIFRKYLDGIEIFGKVYHFLAFSSSQLRNSSCWFFSETTLLSCDAIRRNIGDLSTIKIAAKYAARLGQPFSASMPTINLNKVNIKLEDDIKNPKGKLFSDGIGKISSNLLLDIIIKLKIKGIVSAIQVRFGGVKGVLALDQTLPNNTIVIRPSMQKFETKFETLEVLDYAKYRIGYLNRQILILLMSLGFDEEYAIELQNKYIEALDKLELRDASIFKYLNNHYHGAVLNDFLRDALNNNIIISEEPFLQGVIQTVKARNFLLLKKKCAIMVEKSVRLLGILDEYKVLKEGEIFFQYSPTNSHDDIQYIPDEQEVIVTRNPCLHPGDIRKLKAVRRPEVLEYLGHMVNVILFPQVGNRPHTTEISGSDLDGDLFFVCWDSRLLPTQIVEPMEYDTIKPEEVPKVDMEMVKQFFVDYINNDILGRIDNSHLAIADSSEQLGFSPACLKLSELHGIAVDFVKTGQIPPIYDIEFAKTFPDFMERSHKDFSYESTTLLGRLYRMTKSEIENLVNLGKSMKDSLYPESKMSNINIDEDFIYNGWEKYVSEAWTILKMFYWDLDSNLSLLEIESEFELFSGNVIKLHKIKKGKKKQKTEKIEEKIVDILQHIQNKYRTLFQKDFQALSLSSYEDFTDEQKAKASAWYAVSYYNPDTTPSHIAEIIQNNEGYQKCGNDIIKRNQKYIGLPWFSTRTILFKIKKEANFRKGDDVSISLIEFDKP